MWSMGRRGSECRNFFILVMDASYCTGTVQAQIQVIPCSKFQNKGNFVFSSLRTITGDLTLKRAQPNKLIGTMITSEYEYSLFSKSCMRWFLTLLFNNKTFWRHCLSALFVSTVFQHCFSTLFFDTVSRHCFWRFELLIFYIMGHFRLNLESN